MSRNFHFFAMRKAMSPLHKTKAMKKKTKNKPRTKATIYIKYDAEKAENLIGYATRWGIRRSETLNISRFIRMLIEKYDITKSAFHETSGIHNMAFNKYQNVPDNAACQRKLSSELPCASSSWNHPSTKTQTLKLTA